jgi:hypothetical protein
MAAQPQAPMADASEVESQLDSLYSLLDEIQQVMLAVHGRVVATARPVPDGPSGKEHPGGLITRLSGGLRMCHLRAEAVQGLAVEVHRALS